MARARGRLLHVLGAGLWQCPTIAAAKRLGCRVLVTDIYERRPGYELADDHVVCDIRDARATLAIARARRIDGILCDTTDVGVRTAAFVASELGLPGLPYEVALNFTDKWRMRRISQAAGAANPRCFEAGDAAQARAAARELGLPVVVKPKDNQSSRGVSIVRDARALPGALAAALESSREPAALVEEFIEGTEVTVEGFALAGRYRALAVSDKTRFRRAPQVASRLTYPPRFDEATIERIRRANEAVVRALGLTDGPTHGEYIVNRRGVFLVEIAARGGGSRIYSHIVPRLSGVPLPELSIRLALGEKPAWPRVRGGGAANLEFFEFPSGRVRRVRGLERARATPGVEELELEFVEGDVLRPIADDRGRPGFMVVYGRNRAEALSRSARAKRLVQVEVSK